MPSKVMEGAVEVNRAALGGLSGNRVWMAAWRSGEGIYVPVWNLLSDTFPN